ncbi:MAG: hypothetical protein HQK96_06990 [Nitrospirae bacterium]|nr:hypothetical protein [Nitrospirota bacterium]
MGIGDAISGALKGARPKELVVLHKNESRERIVKVRCSHCFEATFFYFKNDMGKYYAPLLCNKCGYEMFVDCEWNPEC